MARKKNMNKVLLKAGYDPSIENYKEIAKAAGRLAKAGLKEEKILEEIRKEFGETVPKQQRSSPPQGRLMYRANPVPIEYFGELGTDLDDKVVDQIQKAARLPVAKRAAVMPDGHSGYALPIGGVIALDNAVSPSFVGYDIACRVTTTILDITPDELLENRQAIARDMRIVSSFGLGSGFRGQNRRDHPVIHDHLWERIPALKKLRSLAWEQLGSSGGGNHFFDALTGEVIAEAEWMPLHAGEKFAAIMTHSGSRGVGNQLARHYQRVAQRENRKIATGIPNGYEWLDLDTAAGKEYWDVMQLMGRYAQANHHLIHDYFLKQSGLQQLVRWENHHNFAFKEEGLVIHHKGATPAHVGQIGIVPGSSGTASYLVEGLGNEASLNSTSHGAGRFRSRTASKKQHDERAYRNHMKYHDIMDIGVATDETFMAYKDIERVMALQEGVLVRSIARMFPSIVVMGGKSDDGD